MKNLVMLILIFIGTVAARLSDEKCKEYYKQPNNKNGDLINKFPHMGLLGYGNDNDIKYNCPATLISESFALTPAFCLTSPQKLPNHILLGTSKSNDNTPNRKVLNITETLINPKYSKTDSGFRHSVALVKFAPITPTDNIRPGCLYTKSVDDKQTLVDLLWSRSGPERTLFTVNSAIIPKDSCEEYYKKQITIDDYSHLCVHRKFDGEYVVHIGGTSHVVEDEIPKIAAIDNFGPRIPSKELPDVTTNLFNYIDWIEENVWKK